MPRAPHRTCVACRRVRPQGELIRLVRGPDGSVEVDRARVRGGRGAYVCPQSACVDESVRRGRFGHAFRAPVRTTPASLEALYRLLGPERPTPIVRSMPPEGRG